MDLYQVLSAAPSLFCRGAAAAYVDTKIGSWPKNWDRNFRQPLSLGAVTLATDQDVSPVQATRPPSVQTRFAALGALCAGPGPGGGADCRTSS